MPDNERVDGRELVELGEPGSDALLLRGLIRALVERESQALAEWQGSSR